MRSRLKNRNLVQIHDQSEFQNAGIHQYFEDLERGSNKDLTFKSGF